MKKIFTFIFCNLLAIISFAKSPDFRVNGNQLVPAVKTDIELKSEVLSITLSDKEYTDIDVYYEFFNPGASVMFMVYFEAKAPATSDEYKVKDVKDGHPFIYNFTTVVNGDKQPCRTNLVYENSFREIRNAEECLKSPFSFGYFITVGFKHGINTIHHSYRIMNSGDEYNLFHIPYMLTPSAKWGNNCIGEFTLMINSVTTAKHFCIDNTPFQKLDFHIAGGDGKTRTAGFSGRKITEVYLRNATAIWKVENFKPTAELDIYSADWMVKENHDKILARGLFYDRTIPDYQPLDNLSDAEKEILMNLPYASRGLVFDNPNLNMFFNNVWWYIPDPDWKAGTKGFTVDEKRMISKCQSNIRRHSSSVQ